MRSTLFSHICFILFVAGCDSSQVSVIADGANTATPSVPSGILSTLTGSISGTAGFANGLVANATLNYPTGMALDASGNMFITDSMNNSIRMIVKVSGTYFGNSLTAGNVYTVAGTGPAGYTGDGGPASSATMDYCYGTAVDSRGNLYIADSSNSAVRMVVNIAGTYFGAARVAGNIYTISGTGVAGYSGDGGLASLAQFQYLYGIAVDSLDNIYVAESNNVIRMIVQTDGNYFGAVRAGGKIYTIAGTGAPGFTGEGGQAILATLNDPEAVEIDSFGNVYIADSGNNAIRMLVNVTGTYFGRFMITKRIYTLVGKTGVAAYTGDGGLAGDATLNYPEGIALDSANNLYIADYDNQVIRMMTHTSGTYFGVAMTLGNIYSIAGTGVSSYSGDGGNALLGTLSGPYDTLIDANGDLLISDSDNNVIRKVTK